MIGQTISHYKVIEKIGQGGMGEVYRAEDTNLSREVAIKVLPEQFTQDPQRLARFEREAKLLASLNHPNIAAIYGFEKAEGVHFLALELVPGETLAERVAKGPVPVEEALEVCRQIAEGVEAAHEKGVIHRDLKPANVKVTPEGKVKILDFGLAKAFEDEIPAADISQSPTLTEEMTRAGVILGTAAYMSPEQAKGKSVDNRTDIFAFGSVLYELLTGKRAFEGETVTDTLARVLQGQPDWKALPEDTPTRVIELLTDCLEKDSAERLPDIGHVRIQIKKALKEPITVSPIGAASAAQPSLWKRAIPWSITAVVIVLAAVGFWNLTRPGPLAVSRLAMTLSATERLANLNRPAVALSPDGTHLVYAASRDNSQRQLYLRAMDQLQAEPIAGTEGAVNPFFSPDGQWVGFFANGKLKKISISGGAPLTLCDVPNSRGASWGANDTIIFTPSSGTAGLLEVPAAGGTPQVVTTLDAEKGEDRHRWPQFLPEGKAVLFNVWAGDRTVDDALIVVQQLETGERRVLVEGGNHPHYVPTGHLVYARAGTLMAVPFDLARLEVTGPPVAVVEGITQSIGVTTAQFSFSRLGALVYVPGDVSGTESTLVWVNRQGAVESLGAPPRAYAQPRLSPDGRRLAVHITEARQNVWVYDIPRGTLTRLTFEGSNNWAIWTPDGKRLTFSATRPGAPFNVFWKPADGSGAAEQLTTTEHGHFATSWSPDGQVLAFTENHPTTARDIWLLPLEGERQPRPFLRTPFSEAQAKFSPDGRWLAYVSNESGRWEVYVQPFPGPGEKLQISTEGGTAPVWARNGRELFYRNGDKMLAVDVTTQPGFGAGTPTLLFAGPYQRPSSSNTNYDVAADGQSFLMIKASEQEAESSQINVVLNWFEELKRLVPTN